MKLKDAIPGVTRVRCRDCCAKKVRFDGVRVVSGVGWHFIDVKGPDGHVDSYYTHELKLVEDTP